MTKEETIQNYILGNYALYNNILATITNKQEMKYDILVKENRISALLGATCNIMVAIKDDITKNIGSYLYSLLQYSANKIASYNGKNYEIDGYIFKDPVELFNTIRNKLAHGNFYLDASHNKVILEINSHLVRVNVEYLADYAVAISTYFKRVNIRKEYELSFVGCMPKKRVAPNPYTPNYKDIKEIIKNTREYKIVLRKKDGNIPDNNVVEELNKYYMSFRVDANAKVFADFRKKYSKDYELVVSKNKLSGLQEEELANDLMKKLSKENEYIFVARYTGARYQMLIDKNYERINSILANVDNITLLKAIKRTQSADYEKTYNYITNYLEKPDFCLDSYNLLAASIGIFNAMFSYTKDDLLINTNKYTNKENNGFDYSLLNLSAIVIDKAVITPGKQKDLEIQKNKYQKKISEKEAKILGLDNKLNNSREKSEERKASLQKVINNIEREIAKLRKCQNEIEGKIKEYDNYTSAHPEYLLNEAIINGIRNSICHGTYKMIEGEGPTLKDTIIIFEVKDRKDPDVPPTFKCEVNLEEFSNMLAKNIDVLVDYLNTKEEVSKVRKLTR